MHRRYDHACYILAVVLADPTFIIQHSSSIIGFIIGPFLRFLCRSYVPSSSSISYPKLVDSQPIQRDRDLGEVSATFGFDDTSFDEFRRVSTSFDEFRRVFATTQNSKPRAVLSDRNFILHQISRVMPPWHHVACTSTIDSSTVSSMRHHYHEIQRSLISLAVAAAAALFIIGDRI